MVFFEWVFYPGLSWILSPKLSSDILPAENDTPSEAVMKFETMSSHSIYRGRAFSVRKDRVRLPDGAETNLDIVEHVGAVTILPVDDQGNVWFVRQYRHAVEQELLELPAGTLEASESPESCAQREIREEIGMGAGKIQYIGEFFMAPGYSTELMHVFLATDLYDAPLDGDTDEFLQVECVPLEKVADLIQHGKIVDGKTLAVFYLAIPYLEL
jgi:ADP-ribose pyrophosphatase